MKKLTPIQALEIIENLCLEVDGKFAEEIYKIAHCTKKTCVHKDWQDEIYNKYWTCFSR